MAALARGLGDPHKVFGGVLHVREVGKGTFARHSDVRVQREVQDGVDARGSRRRHLNITSGRREIEEHEADLIMAWHDGIETIRTMNVGHDQPERAPVALEFDRYARKRSAGLVADDTGHARCLRQSVRRDRKPKRRYQHHP